MVLCRDCHTAASLLKMWLRDLYEPLIPDAFYDECIALAVNLDKDSVNKPEKAKRLAAFVTRLPELNALVLMYLVRFLQLFAQTSVSLVTKMDDSNLATVFFTKPYSNDFLRKKNYLRNNSISNPNLS